MITPTVEIEIYEGQWGQRVYAYALKEHDARQAVINHFAFGDPDEDDYAIGNHWMTENDEDGWRITRRTVTAANIFGEKSGDFEEEETVHLIWKCPYCDQYFSEDLSKKDQPPLLLVCGCKNEMKYILVNF